MSEAPNAPDGSRPPKVITPRASRPAAPRGATPTTPGGSRVVYPARGSGSRVHRLWTNVSWVGRAALVSGVGLVVVGSVVLARQPRTVAPPPAAPTIAAPLLAATLPSAAVPGAVGAAVAVEGPGEAPAAARNAAPAAAPAPAPREEADSSLGPSRTIAGLLAAQSGDSAAGAAPAPTAVGADVRAAVDRVVAAYASAIDRRNVDGLARIYPAMSDAERASWTRFFAGVGGLDARLAARDVRAVAEGVIEARVAGAYSYDAPGTTRGVRQPVEFVGRFSRDGSGAWRMVSVR